MISKKSSSLHNINADNSLSPVKKRVYRIANWINNHWPDLSKNKLRNQVPFFLNPVKSPVGTNSPSRHISNLFWAHLPWQGIQGILGKINLLDYGCGTGRYAHFWKHYAGDAIDSYLGIDVKKHAEWDSLPDGFETGVLYHSIELDEALAKTNVLCSQSVLEHVVFDMDLFRRIFAHDKKTGKKRLQIHLIPGVSGFEQWPFHGVRQYPAHALHRIAEIFTGYDCRIYPLGFRSSTNVHLNFISKPLREIPPKDRRFEDPKKYEEAVLDALTIDSQAPEGSPCFLALVIAPDVETGKLIADNFSGNLTGLIPGHSFLETVRLLGPQSTVIDCGANVGKYTRLFAGTGARVFAFEPNPDAFNVLQERVKWFGNVTAYKKGVWIENEHMKLFKHENANENPVKWSVGSSLLAEKENVSKDSFFTIETIRLSEFILTLNRKVDILKIDIEGAEVHVLTDLIDTGAINRVEKIFVELHDEKISALREPTEKLRQRIAAENLSAKIDLTWH